MSPRKPIYRVVINSWALDDENKRPRWQFTTWKDYYLFICLLFRSVFGLNQPAGGWRQRSPTTAKFLLVDPRAASARSVVYMLGLIVLFNYQRNVIYIYNISLYYCQSTCSIRKICKSTLFARKTCRHAKSTNVLYDSKKLA